MHNPLTELFRISGSVPCPQERKKDVLIRCEIRQGTRRNSKTTTLLSNNIKLDKRKMEIYNRKMTFFSSEIKVKYILSKKFYFLGFLNFFLISRWS